MLELDRTRRFAVAAGRACPERFVGDDVADQRRQRRIVAFEDRFALREQMPLDAIVDPLERQRLAGEKRRTSVLAAAAFGAGEGVQSLLPGEVARGADAELHLAGIALAHDLLEI